MDIRSEFVQCMGDYAGFMEEVAAQEGEKYAALLSYDHKRMDKAIAAQQAINMRLEKFEDRRVEAQLMAGYGDLTFREILVRAQDPEKESLRGLFARIEKSIMDIKYLNGKSLSFAKEGMHLISSAAEQAGPSYTVGVGKTAEKAEHAVSLFEANV